MWLWLMEGWTHQVGLLAREAARGLDATAQVDQLQGAGKGGTAVELALHKRLQFRTMHRVRQRIHCRRRKVAGSQVLTLQYP